jgi:hypothetical protein
VNQHGIKLDADNWTSGPTPRQPPDQLAEFATIAEAGPKHEVEGVVRWRWIDLKRVIPTNSVSSFTGSPKAPLGKLTARRNSSRQPRYRRLANVEATRQVGLAGGTVSERIQGLALLMSGKLGRSAHMNPPRLGASSTFPSSGTNQFTLKLGEAAKNREHQSAMRRGRVCPNVGQ